MTAGGTSWPQSWPEARTELAALWHVARARPVRAAAVALGVTVAAATVVGVAATLVTDPARVLDAAVSTPLMLGLFAGAVWAVSWMVAVVAGALVSTWGLFVPRSVRTRIAVFFRATGALLGAAVAWVVVVGFSVVPVLTVALTVAAVAVWWWRGRDQRRRETRLRWLTGHLIGAAREFDPESGAWQISGDEWDGDHLTRATAHYPADVRVSEPNVRRGIERAAMWAMRHEPHLYTLRWSQTGRTVDLVAEPPLPDYFLDAAWPRFRSGIPLAVCPVSRADEIVLHHETGEKIGLRCWDPTQERDLLVCGVKGSGKTIFCRRLIVHGLRGGWFDGGVYVLDGKTGDDYIPLEGRQGIRAVAVEAEEWGPVLTKLVDIVTTRYTAKRDAARREEPPPKLDRILVLIDEIQNIIAKIPGAEEQVEELARMARAAGVTLVFATQRPDTKNVLPGAVRDQLEDRAACGWMSEQGARMVLAEAWRLVVDEDDATGETATLAKPRGRAVMKIAGKLDRVQIPWMDSPLADPQWAALYPPKEALQNAPAAPRATKPAAAKPTTPAPREAAHDAPAPAAPPLRDDFFE